MNIDELTPEQQEKANACKTAEELVALAKEEGIELSDDDLEQISGGGAWKDATDSYKGNCTRCGKEIRWTGSEGAPKMCPYCGETLISH